jgi:hypothetical protein
MKNDCLDAALRELSQVGIRPRRQDDRRHVFLEWDVPGGKRRQYTVPKTPSDWRARLNARSDVRRLIREDALDVAHAQKSALAKALELPPIPLAPERPDERLIRLERDQEALIDLVGDLSAEIRELSSNQPKIELSINGVPMRVEPVPVPSPVPAPAQVKPILSRGCHGYLVSLMSEEWIRVKDLAEKSGLSPANVSVTLTHWK